MTELKQMLLDRGAALVGFADLSGIARQDRRDMPRAVSIAVSLDARIVAGIRRGPTREYCAEYRRVNDRLNALGSAAAEFLQGGGHRAEALAATGAGVDPRTHSTALPHKTAATLAGLGWIGKCALLVTEQFGSAVRLATVLTDAELPAGPAVDCSRCGDCTSCLRACPGHAPTGRNWQPGMAREDLFDAFVCRKAAMEIAARNTGVAQTVCGMCIRACPWTERYIELVIP